MSHFIIPITVAALITIFTIVEHKIRRRKGD